MVGESPREDRRSRRVVSGGSPAGPAGPGRVLVVSQVTVSAVATHVRDLVFAGQKAGFDITVACPENGDLSGWALDIGVEWHPLEMRRSPHLEDLGAVAEIRRLASRADLVHLHSSKAGAVGRLALASMARRPCVFTPHGWSWLAGGPMVPAYKAFERMAARFASVIVAVSQGERALGASVLGATARRIRVIENGVDTDRFSPDGPVADRSAAPLIVCVGRLCHAKAQDVALAALARMRSRDARLRLVGDGEQREALRALASRLGLEGRVEMIGHDLDPAPHMRAADLIVVPSRYDGMSLALLEAMSCGSAVVATSVPGSEILEGVGLVVPVEDPASMAAALDELLSSPDQRAVLGRGARHRVVESYHLDRSLDATVDLWRELATSVPRQLLAPARAG